MLWIHMNSLIHGTDLTKSHYHWYINSTAPYTAPYKGESDKDHQYVQRVWCKFNVKNLGDYQDHNNI